MLDISYFVAGLPRPRRRRAGPAVNKCLDAEPPWWPNLYNYYNKSWLKPYSSTRHSLCVTISDVVQLRAILRPIPPRL
eukprot:9479715-Pyramimonas_sp.AAC.2